MPLGLHTANLNFETLQEVGQEGRNSQVYLAHDKQLDGRIVVKKISKANLPNASDFYREAKILYSSAHSNVVKINYGCSDTDNIFIAMPFYANGSLKRLIDQRFLTVREVIRYAIQFLSGLNNIHSKGLLHFDIKPDNILLSDSNEALLSDFGLSKAMDNLGFADPDGVYRKQVPPETFTHSQKSRHFDIYLSGLTIYRLLNGNDHYNAQFNFSTRQEYIDAITNGYFPNRNSYLPHIPLKLQRIINKALSVNIIDRHKNVLELVNELGGVDENLDWQYSVNGSIQTWDKVLGDRSLKIELTRNTNGYSLYSTKTIHTSNRTTRITAHCKTNLTNSNYLSNLKQALREI